MQEQLDRINKASSFITLTAKLLSGLGLTLGGISLTLPDCEAVGEWGVLPLLCNPCLLSAEPP